MSLSSSLSFNQVSKHLSLSLSSSLSFNQVFKHLHLSLSSSLSFNQVLKRNFQHRNGKLSWINCERRIFGRKVFLRRISDHVAYHIFFFNCWFFFKKIVDHIFDGRSSQKSYDTWSNLTMHHKTYINEDIYVHKLMKR